MAKFSVVDLSIDNVLFESIKAGVCVLLDLVLFTDVGSAMK